MAWEQWKPFDGKTELGEGYLMRSGDGFITVRLKDEDGVEREKLSYRLPPDVRFCRFVPDTPEDALRAENAELRAFKAGVPWDAIHTCWAATRPSQYPEVRADGDTVYEWWKANKPD